MILGNPALASRTALVEHPSVPVFRIRRPGPSIPAQHNIIPFFGNPLARAEQKPQLEDVFPRRGRELLLAVAAKPGKLAEIGKELGIMARGANALSRRVLERAKELGLPKPLVFTNPQGFEMTPEFAGAFGIPCERFKPIQLFSKTERSFIEFVSKTPGATYSEIAAVFGRHFDIFVERICWKCEARSLPKPFVVSGRGPNVRYFVSDGFLAACGLPSINSEFDAKFTPREAKLLMFLADAPWASKNEMCGALGLRWNQIKEILRSIREKDNLALKCMIKYIGKGGVPHYALSDEFVARWGFQKPKPFASPAHQKAEKGPALSHKPVKFHKIYLVRLIDELDRRRRKSYGIVSYGRCERVLRNNAQFAAALDAAGGLRTALGLLDKRNAALAVMEAGTLIRESKLGSRGAQNALVLKYELMAAGFAKPYHGFAAAYGIHPDDIRQESRLAIVDAAARFDPLAGFGFGPALKLEVRSRCINFMLDNKSVVRVPRIVQNALRKMRKALAACQGEGAASERNLAEAVQQLGAAPVARPAIAGSGVGKPDISLNVPVSDEEGAPEKIDFVPADSVDLIEALIADYVRKSVADIGDPLKRAVLERQLGLKNGRAQSTREITAQLGIKEAKVGELLGAALDDLRNGPDARTALRNLDRSLLKGALVEEPAR